MWSHLQAGNRHQRRVLVQYPTNRPTVSICDNQSGLIVRHAAQAAADDMRHPARLIDHNIAKEASFSVDDAVERNTLRQMTVVERIDHDLLRPRRRRPLPCDKTLI